MKETPAAQEALEDYYNLGPERSLAKLLTEYQVKRARGEAVPTANSDTLYDWSRKHGWQERLRQRIEDEAAEVRKRLQERAIKFRERVTGAIEVDVTRLLQRLRNSEGEVLAESAADVERLVKLFYQLAEQPLSDKTELAGEIGLRQIVLKEVPLRTDDA